MVKLKRPDHPLPIPAKRTSAKGKPAAEAWFETRYLNHPRLGIVMWTTPAAAPGFLTHKEMADLLPRAFKHNGIGGGDVLPIASAGYVKPGPFNKPYCVGESETLGVKAAPGDTALLWQMLAITP